MGNKIKIGDKVRLSKDAPSMFFYGADESFIGENGVVSCIEDGNAFIKYGNGTSGCMLAIPCKYLVKVDAAKEAKFKYQVGQKVKSVYANEILTIKECRVTVCHDKVYRVEEYPYTWRECELRPYTEPTEQTEEEKNPHDGISECSAKEISDMLEAYTKALSGIVDSFDWQRYEAYLAKEIVLKVANKYTDPKELAEYAVQVSEQVVKKLKK